MKLKSKLVLGNMLMVILTMGCLTLSQLFISSYYSDQILEKTSNNTAEQFVEHATTMAQQTVSYLAEALLNPMYFYDIETMYSILEPALQHDSVTSIFVFDTQGRVVHTGEEFVTDYGMMIDNTAMTSTVLKQQRAFSQVNDLELTLAQPLIMNQTLLGGVVMTYSLNLVQRDIEDTTLMIQEINRLSRAQTTLLTAVVTLAMCLLSLWFSVLLSGTLITPLAKLLHHSRRISRGEFHSSNNIVRRDELGELAEAFNDMAINLKQRNDKIEFLAYNDALTRLPNRTQFLRHLETQMRSNSPSYRDCSVFYIDLDGFKRVNDNFGHQAGDELLCHVARILSTAVDLVSHNLGKQSGLTARVGGDEFLICLSGEGDHDWLSSFAANIAHQLRQPIWLQHVGESVVLGASIGIATSSAFVSNAEDLVKKADLAMYTVKSKGKSGFGFFTHDIEQKVLEKGHIERELRLALADFSQFKLYYQPKFSLATGTIVGVEALIRWQHPSKGFIPPDHFIPVAEATDIIHTLSDWIIKQVCRDIQHWQSHLSLQDFYVALNLSPKQLYGNKIVSTILQQLELHQVETSRLHVEVTETALMNDTVSAKATLDDLRSHGIQVWLDDFGTGFSSLSYLRKFSVDGLKIDRSFVSDIDDDNNDRSLCSAVISMAHQLGIKVTAEGIESRSQAAFLSKMKCDYGQGYLFAKPMPFDELERQWQGFTQPHSGDNVVHL